MPICTPVVRRRQVVSRIIPPRPALRPTAVTPQRAKPSKLEQVEERLLSEALDHYSAKEAALDTALDDMALLSAELNRSRRRPLLLRSTTNLGRIEDLLLEAIVRTHPNGERALDRLMADVSPHDGEETDAEQTIDNDFDGLS